MTPEILRDHNAHALIVFKEGRKWIRALALHAPPVRVVKLPKDARRYLAAMEYHGKPYPMARALRHFRRAGRTFGITASAKAILRSLKNSGPD